MTKTVIIILLAIFFSPITSLGQKDGSFKIDTAKILANENLDNFVTSLEIDTFQIFSEKTEIPKFVKRQLNRLTKGFSIANPNQDYQCCCTSPKRLPERKLEFLAISNNVLAMTYLTGGFGVSTHLLLIKFENNKVVDLWTGYCHADIKNVAEIVSYINESKKNNRELNTNIIIL